jgi:hypothetical protein
MQPVDKSVDKSCCLWIIKLSDFTLFQLNVDYFWFKSLQEG